MKGRVCLLPDWIPPLDSGTSPRSLSAVHSRTAFAHLWLLLLLLLSGLVCFPARLGQQLLSLQECLGRMFPEAVRGLLVTAGSAPIGGKAAAGMAPQQHSANAAASAA